MYLGVSGHIRFAVWEKNLEFFVERLLRNLDKCLRVLYYLTV